MSTRHVDAGEGIASSAGSQPHLARGLGLRPPGATQRYATAGRAAHGRGPAGGRPGSLARIQAMMARGSGSSVSRAPRTASRRAGESPPRASKCGCGRSPRCRTTRCCTARGCSTCPTICCSPSPPRTTAWSPKGPGGAVRAHRPQCVVPPAVPRGRLAAARTGESVVRARQGAVPGRAVRQNAGTLVASTLQQGLLHRRS